MLKATPFHKFFRPAPSQRRRRCQPASGSPCPAWRPSATARPAPLTDRRPPQAGEGRGLPPAAGWQRSPRPPSGRGTGKPPPPPPHTCSPWRRRAGGGTKPSPLPRTPQELRGDVASRRYPATPTPGTRRDTGEGGRGRARTAASPRGQRPQATHLPRAAPRHTIPPLPPLPSNPRLLPARPASRETSPQPTAPATRRTVTMVTKRRGGAREGRFLRAT